LRGALKIVESICIEVNPEFISNFGGLFTDGKLDENLKSNWYV
jgi:hypothetical protein